MSTEPNAVGGESLGAVGALGPQQPLSPQQASQQQASPQQASPQQASQQQASQQQASQQQASPQQAPQRTSPQRRCRYFRSGNCSYGNSCKFLHQPSPSAQGGATADSAAKEKTVCRYYQNGWCRYGARCSFAHPRSSKKQAAAVAAEPSSDRSRLDSQTPRDTEIAQFRKHFPMHSIDGEWLGFMFSPSAPDWPYDVRELQLMVNFPEQYPADPFAIRLGTNERVPEMVCRLLDRRIAELAATTQSRRCPGRNSAHDVLPFCLFLSELDKQMEDCFTASLVAYKRELQAKAAGIQLVPFYELRATLANKNRSPEEGSALPGSEQQVLGHRQQSEYSTTTSETRTAEDAANYSEVETASRAERDRLQSTSAASSDLEESDDDQESDVDGDDDEAAVSAAAATKPRGTEVRLCGMQLVGAAATLLCTRLALVVSCGRCRNCELLPVAAGAAASSQCSRCHEPQTVSYDSAMAHTQSSTLGYLRLDGCVPFDVALVSCSLTIGCLNCGKDNALKGIHPGAVNKHWCLHCHQKMEVSVEKCSFVVFGLAAAGSHIDGKSVEKVQRSGKARSVRHPAVREGEPLPDEGTCAHFKKSYRWFRFPCCGKLYPCTICHDAQEKDHEGEIANRMVCGFCCKEQPFSPDPCVSCGSFLNRPKSAHWEGGKGCRDSMQMDRHENRKYSNREKTISRRSTKSAESSKNKSGNKSKNNSSTNDS